jgi:hypothetical protein
MALILLWLSLEKSVRHRGLVRIFYGMRLETGKGDHLMLVKDTAKLVDESLALIQFKILNLSLESLQLQYRGS